MTVRAGGVERFKQMGQEIVGCPVRLLRQNPAAGGDDTIDFGFEKLQRRAHPEPAEPRDKVGHAENVERADFPDRVEIGGHRHADVFGVGSETIREDGAFDDIERDLGHLGRHVDGGARAERGPSVDQGAHCCHHRRRKIHHRPARKHRGEYPPLQAPLLALGAQQAVTQSRRQYPALQAVLAVVGGVIQQDAADGAGLVNQQHVADRQATGNDRLLEMRRRPAFERIAFQGTEQGQRLERPRLRLWRRWTIRAFRGWPVAVFCSLIHTGPACRANIQR